MKKKNLKIGVIGLYWILQISTCWQRLLEEVFPGGEADLFWSHGLLPPRPARRNGSCLASNKVDATQLIITWPLPSLCPRPADRPGAEGRPAPHAGPPHHHRQEEARLLQRLSAEVQLAGGQSLLSWWWWWWWWAWKFKGQKDGGRGRKWNAKVFFFFPLHRAHKGYRCEKNQLNGCESLFWGLLLSD